VIYNMKPSEIIRKIYYGDSGCKKVIIDGWGGSVTIQLDSMFIMKGDFFDYVVDEEINDGFIVFEGVDCFSWTGELLPNDVINSISCNSDSANEKGKYIFSISVNNVDSSAHSNEIVLSISAASVSVKRC